jgi:hypothetical protein
MIFGGIKGLCHPNDPAKRQVSATKDAASNFFGAKKNFVSQKTHFEFWKEDFLSKYQRDSQTVDSNQRTIELCFWQEFELQRSEPQGTRYSPSK